MNQDREVNVNWLRINVPSIAAIIVAAVTISSYVQSLASDIKKIEDTRQTNKALLDKDIDNIQKKLDNVADAPLRLDLLEKNLAATNARMDTYLQTLGTKIDGVSDRVGSLTTKVEVLAQKIEQITPPRENKAGRTRFFPH